MPFMLTRTPVGTHNNFNNQMPEAAIIEDKMTGFFSVKMIGGFIIKDRLWFSNSI